MAPPSSLMHLGAFLYPSGHHIAAWRHPDAVADAGLNFPHYRELAGLAERGLFDMIFLADTVAAQNGIGDRLKRLSYVSWIDPLIMVTALAAVTRHIGLICTATTTFEEPFSLARRFASLDVLSQGRAGWNLVTSANPYEALNYGWESHPSTQERYERAREFAAVVKGLWDSWEDDAFVRDKASGLFFHPEKLHLLEHSGKHFKVRGPLNVSRSPQGQPVLVQAGASNDGRQVAAELGEVIFTAQPSLEEGVRFYRDVKERAAAAGRDPAHVKVMPGFSVTVGESRAQAQEKLQALQQCIHPEVGMQQLSYLIGHDLSGHPIDGPLPDIPKRDSAASRTDLLISLARRDNLTIRQLYERIALGRGHHQVTGTAADIADEMEQWFKGGAADGFNVMCALLPTGLEDFVGLVVPELQRRGLYRTRYEGTTLRGHLGLPRPANRYAASVD